MVMLMTNSMSGLGDLREWQREGAVKVEKDSAAFSAGSGSIELSLKSKGLNIYYIEAASSIAGKNAKVALIASCLNSRGKTVYQVSSTSAADKEEGILGLYFKTHLETKTLRVRIEKSGEGAAKVGGVVIRDDDANRVIHKPKVDLNQYCMPVWQGSVAYDESAIFLGEDPQELSASLLLISDEVLSVTDSTKTIAYKEGKDYRVDGTQIVRLEGSRMPYVNPSELPKGDLPWYEIKGKHVLVTYRHGGKYDGPKPADARTDLPETYQKLVSKKPLKIVGLGDSIMLGSGTSGYSMEPPFMPPWSELLAYRWSRVYGNKTIKAVNVSLGGQTSYWARDIAPSCVASLKPDLVLIALGMNDFWSISPEEFKANVQAVIASIRTENKKVEFVLISSIPFDPEYSSDKYYLGNIEGYAGVLKSLTGHGIAYVDMNAIGKYLSDVKGHKSLTGDPMHPIDYFARWYGGMVASLFDRTQSDEHK